MHWPSNDGTPQMRQPDLVGCAVDDSDSFRCAGGDGMSREHRLPCGGSAEAVTEVAQWRAAWPQPVSPCAQGGAVGTGMPGEIRIEDVVACVHCEDALSLEEVQRAVAHLPAACIPRHWWRCPELAPDARGKIARHHWRQRFLKEPPLR